MSKRFGRKQKRALRDRISYLETVAYGPAGPCPDHIESIDDLVYSSKTIRIEDDPRRGYETSVSIEIPLFDRGVMDRVMDMRDGPVRLDGRCLINTGTDMPRTNGIQVLMTMVHFKQIVPPRLSAR
jgi:hypothetical protein